MPIDHQRILDESIFEGVNTPKLPEVTVFTTKEAKQGYSKAQKATVVKLVAEGTSIPNVSKELGIPASTIYHWFKDIKFVERVVGIRLATATAGRSKRLSQLDKLGDLIYAAMLGSTLSMEYAEITEKYAKVFSSIMKQEMELTERPIPGMNLLEGGKAKGGGGLHSLFNTEKGGTTNVVMLSDALEKLAVGKGPDAKAIEHLDIEAQNTLDDFDDIIDI